jgi:phosphoribosylformimino-5-aminoimidazole carboxamide ribotide isomerase
MTSYNRTRISPCRLVPAIDLISGRSVRLSRGDFSTQLEVGSGDPLILAQEFAELGFGRLHLVDLDGARSGAPKHLELLRAITQSTPLEVDISGGLRTASDIEAALAAGAKQVVIGSSAVINPRECHQWFKSFGGERIILGVDILERTVRVKGWIEDSGMLIDHLIEDYLSDGLSYLMSTDISRDGMLNGPALELYRELTERYPTLKIIASGGIRDVADIEALDKIGVSEAIVGKGLYNGTLKVYDLGGYRY